ncbi:MAG TPA: redoxin family protein [Methylocystis sp.]|jgi:thiol-disulfide isomerase/thioredoxin
MVGFALLAACHFRRAEGPMVTPESRLDGLKRLCVPDRASRVGNDRSSLRGIGLLAFAIFSVAATGAFAIDFKPYGRGAFARIAKAHSGRPLVIHFWSVTCPPCIAELPQWAKMLAERKDVDIVFVNVDSDEDRVRAEVRAEKAGLGGATHYGFSDDFIEKLYFEADTSWRGELPFTTLVAPGGGVTAVTGAIDDPLVTRWLETRR